MGKHKFPYRWNLADGYPAKGIEPNGLNVFGTFICGGGSTMGYKLAGLNHLGGVEIDAKVADVYRANHKPKYLYVEDIRAFNKRTDLPSELYQLDILDGSPPCSTFSMAGSRESAWGKEKVFREGQAKQTLDDLVFVYIETIKKLKPKVCLLENVKGIIQGNAKYYSKQIVAQMTEAGYRVQVFCLNAASMGVPQKRERVFFIGLRNDFDLPKLELRFNEKSVTFGEYRTLKGNSDKLTERQVELLKLYNGEKTLAEIEIKRTGKNSGFTDSIVKDSETPQTITSAGKNFRAFDRKWFSDEDFKCTGTYPLDYNFKELEPKYLIGMSVPPVQMAQISLKIKEQWFDLIK